MSMTNSWLDKLLRRLPLTQPGTLVASDEGVGVFLGNWAGGDRVYGIKRGGRVLLDLYPTGGGGLEKVRQKETERPQDKSGTISQGE